MSKEHLAMPSDYFPVHAHSEYSWLDGMGTVREMVECVEAMGQPALALTDHGVMSGVAQLYKECRKAGIEPLPGEEFYLVKSVHDESKNNRFHIGMLALDVQGYEALVMLSSLSHRPDRFHRKPLIDFADLRGLQELGVTDHIALTTGCYFGMPVQQLVNGDREAAKNLIRWFASIFPHTFVELQHHDVDHEGGFTDSAIVAEMFGIAQELGLPVVAGQDSHYCDHRYKPAHDMMKEISYHGVDGDDFKFPGDSFHLATARWVKKHYTTKQWSAIEEGHGALLDKSGLVIKELDTYKFSVPSTVDDPDKALKKAVMFALRKRQMHGFDTYDKRIEHELDIIAKMGFSDYFLLVEDVTSWCRSNGIVVNARGSANGSLVCYVLGITNVDPLAWGTSFHRFLSLDRQKPPDIDLDVESGRRADVIAYLREKFPTLVHIGTFMRLGMKMDEEGNESGSLYRQYAGAARRRDESWEGGVLPQHREAMKMLDLMDVNSSAGTHAAGLVLPGNDLPIAKLIPTMLVGGKKGNTVTQFPMEDVEDAGYVKLDLLGLRTLETISTCLEMIGRKRGVIDWIPHDDRKACALLRSGRTVGLFQFEGVAVSRGAKQMKVASTYDASICLALFRPAMMNSGMTDRYLQQRTMGKPQAVPALIESLLSDTYGVPVFQEQVIDIMRRVALPYDDLNAILKAVKASNGKIVEYATDTFSRVAPKFKRLAISNGMTVGEAKFTWQMIKDFADYGFNKAHAVSYGLMSYTTGYLKAHHPIEYMAAVLDTWAGTPKERMYITEARRLKIPIIKSDVNYSLTGWTIDRSRRTESLRRGLITIKGIGAAASNAIVHERLQNGPYESIEDMIERLPARPVSGGKDYVANGTLSGVLSTLADAGALRSIGFDA